MSKITNHLYPGLEMRPYITHRHHEYLAVDAWRSEGANIGLHGEHLTITFLSLNRHTLSIKLCRSIAEHISDFKGELLVIDNGSAAEELKKLRRYLETMPYRWRIEELGENYGVAGGRNRTMPFVRTEWVMSLDNDLYLIKNPLPSIQRDLAVLGCHFMALALVNEDVCTFAMRGAHLYLSFDVNEFVIGGGAAIQSNSPMEESPGYLGTFLPGTACVFRKDTFLAQGGFDEGMFVGFEDYEFSLRLFRAGLKIGVSDVGAFVHDHPAPKTEDDQDYEKARFARKRLEDAAAYFEKKHGYRVWTDGVDAWLKQREDELGLVNSKSFQKNNELNKIRDEYKPKIAIIVDRLDWALANIAKQLTLHLNDEFEFEVFASSQMEHPALLLFMTKDYDLVHYLWREPLHNVYLPGSADYINKLFANWDRFVQECVLPRPITLTVFDHLFLTEPEIESRRYMFQEFVKGYTVSSAKLENIYQNISGYPSPGALTPDGVDLELFYPKNLERFNQLEARPIKIGWVGNSAWGQGLDEDVKGVHTVIKPALQKLREMGFAIEECFADRQIRHLSHAEMPDYYNTIDILICASKHEGTPNPVLEAMACGVPIISTDVGLVSEVMGPLQKRFILSERTVDALVNALIELSSDCQQFAKLSAENCDKIKLWDWSIRADAYRNFFRQQIKQPKPI